jgi:2-dehydro-3-deoxyphosphogluconate aldolase/(4S)-4-hydroxy-2-oxoglutarate aldolase
MSATLDLLLRYRVVVIFRGHEPAVCREVAKAMYAGGIRAFEVTMNSPEALRSVSLLRAHLPDDAAVGAGTVLSQEKVPAVGDAGASFVVSPNVDVSVIEATLAAGLVSIPGALTPTEIVQAHRAGGQIVKVFPAGSVGAGYFGMLDPVLGEVPWLCGRRGVGAERLGVALVPFDAPLMTQAASVYLTKIGNTPEIE